jgi:hypothetical protein
VSGRGIGCWIGDEVTLSAGTVEAPQSEEPLAAISAGPVVETVHGFERYL